MRSASGISAHSECNARSAERTAMSTSLASAQVVSPHCSSVCGFTTGSFSNPVESRQVPSTYMPLRCIIVGCLNDGTYGVPFLEFPAARSWLRYTDPTPTAACGNTRRPPRPNLGAGVVCSTFLSIGLLVWRQNQIQVQYDARGTLRFLTGHPVFLWDMLHRFPVPRRRGPRGGLWAWGASSARE